MVSLLLTFSVLFSSIAIGNSNYINKRRFFTSDIIEEPVEPEDPEEPIIIDNLQFLYRYYYYLRTNIGQNASNLGSCSYVAICELLSYYDTAYSDYFIPETYDQMSTSLDVSPGVVHDNITSSSNISDISASLTSQSTNHFMSYLVLQMDYYLGFFNQPGAPSPLALDDGQMLEVLEQYDAINTNISYLVATKETYNYTSFTDFIIYELNHYRPVLVGAYNADGSVGHALVAYDYGIENNNYVIYFNYGYGASGYHSKLTDISVGGSYLSYISEAYSLEPTFQYTTSNNYQNIPGFSDAVSNPMNYPSIIKH